VNAPDPATVRPNPCPSCPYRRAVASGIWAASEYAKLPAFDGSPADQVTAGALGVFHCHSAREHVCAGWVGHRDPFDLLALRVAVSAGRVDPAALEYRTDVPLFASGAEAAAHGLAELDAPGERAIDAVRKLIIAHPDLEVGP
jgi:Family of unknown function (DUF6283)